MEEKDDRDITCPPPTLIMGLFIYLLSLLLFLYTFMLSIYFSLIGKLTHPQSVTFAPIKIKKMKKKKEKSCIYSFYFLFHIE